MGRLGPTGAQGGSGKMVGRELYIDRVDSEVRIEGPGDSNNAVDGTLVDKEMLRAVLRELLDEELRRRLRTAVRR